MKGSPRQLWQWAQGTSDSKGVWVRTHQGDVRDDGRQSGSVVEGHMSILVAAHATGEGEAGTSGQPGTMQVARRAVQLAAGATSPCAPASQFGGAYFLVSVMAEFETV